jgi:hypothetical protein
VLILPRFLMPMIFPLHQVILSIRTWAIWNRSKTVGILLVVSNLAGLVLQFVLLPRFIRAFECTLTSISLVALSDHAALIDAPPPYPGFRGCFLTKTSIILWGIYAVFTAIEARKRCLPL